MKRQPARTALVALTGVAVTLLAACGSGGSGGSGGSDDKAATSDFLPCIVSAVAGFDDHSFNESALKGITSAADELKIKFKKVESGSEDDFAPNIAAQVNEGCDLIVTVGYPLSDATKAAAKANPDVDFAIVDDGLDADQDGKPDVENGKPILFDTAQAAFLAGYAAAAYSKTGVVGTFGGVQTPPVTLFMDGFVDGVDYYNEQKNAHVRTVGWNKKTQNGVFTGGYVAGIEAKTAAQGLLDQGADVVLPVGGPIYQSAAEAMRDKGGDVALIGVDADVYEADKSVSSLLLTSIEKGIDAGVHDVVIAASKGQFDSTPFVGTLKNGGVGIAPFHDFESKVPAGLQKEIDALKAAIIAGDVTVTSKSTPK
jgi:basic membrane protein A